VLVDLDRDRRGLGADLDAVRERFAATLQPCRQKPR
jgi:hypothetical protein